MKGTDHVHNRFKLERLVNIDCVKLGQNYQSARIWSQHEGGGGGVPGASGQGGDLDDPLTRDPSAYSPILIRRYYY
jgi:hypothetical protein